MATPVKHHHKAHTVQQQPAPQPAPSKELESNGLVMIAGVFMWVLIFYGLWKLKWQRRQYRWKKQGEAWANGVAEAQRRQALKRIG